ncbi:hypothetical protein OG21DRAFT_1489699 [Imleria badia]|nr:hypothetical protein OG21DRAFT_1489699 [Imleria badia]
MRGCNEARGPVLVGHRVQVYQHYHRTVDASGVGIRLTGSSPTSFTLTPLTVQMSQDPSDAEDDEQTAFDVLFHTLSCDPAAEVRRAVLLNMHHILPAILARSRDTDTVICRLVYSDILEKNCTTADGYAMGPLHPPVLTIAQRELIIRNGLGGREPAVRAAAGSLLGAWVDVVRGATKPEEGGAVMDDLVAFLGLFDLNENTVAEDALLSIFTTRIDIFDQLESKGARFWREHCIATNDQAKLEVSLPVVTHLAYRIQSVYNKYQEDLDAVAQERALRERDVDERLDDLLLDAEFVIAEMLKLAVNLDYADEIGRRKMFQLVRDMIGREGLP